MSKKFYITTPIYYVNARPHIGHAYTTIACDTIARRHRMLGDDTWFLTGTDEHGQKIERAAAGRRQDAAAVHRRNLGANSARCGSAWDLRYDDFIRTTSDAPQAAACRRCWRKTREQRIHLQGHLHAASTASPTSSMWTRVGPGAPCPECGRPTETVHEENYFFKLSAFQEQLDEASTPSSPISSAPRRGAMKCFAFVRGGLRDLSISRSTFSWGIPVPDDPKHVVYVWLDALANYITALGYGSDDTQPSTTNTGPPTYT